MGAWALRLTTGGLADMRVLKRIVTEDFRDDRRRVPLIEGQCATGESKNFSAVFTANQFSSGIDDQQIIEETATRWAGRLLGCSGRHRSGHGNSLDRRQTAGRR